MNAKAKSSPVLTLAVLFVLTPACTTYETDKANKLVEEAKWLELEAKKQAAIADIGKGTVFGYDENDIIVIRSDFAKHKSKVKDNAQTMIFYYGKAADMFRTASRKYDEASRMKIKDKFKEYLSLKSQEFGKRAEVLEATKGYPQATLDSDSFSQFESRFLGNHERVEKLSQEAEELSNKAQKLYEENKKSFNN